MGMLGRGCAPDPGPEPAEDCFIADPADLSGLPERAVELGVIAGDSFQAYEDGEAVEMVTGFQGFSMFTPYVELPLADGDEDAPCWWVRLEIVHEDYEDVLHQGGLVFERVGEVMRAGPIFASPFDRGQVQLRLTVVGDEFVAVDQVEVTIP
jgi:hypothetical protein